MNQYFNFSEENQLLPGTLIRAEQLNEFLRAISVGFDGVNGINTKFITVPDGVDAVIDEPLALRRLRLVGFDQAGNISLFGVFRNEGNYTTAKSYVSNSLVKSGKNLYVVNRDFTATTFATDLANGNLSLLIDFDSVIADAQIAIQNEGVVVTTGAEFLNFVGNNVQVSSDANGGVLVQILDQVVTPTYPSILANGVEVVASATDINFVGATVSDDGNGQVTVTVANKSLAVRDEGMQIAADAKSLNFSGAGVTANSNAQGDITITIPGAESGAPVSAPLVVQDEGVQIEDDALVLNFAGEGVTASSVNGVVTVTIPGGGGSTSIAVDDEGLELTEMLARLNFVGGGVVATETSPGVIQVSIPGQTPIAAADEGVQVEDDLRSINFTGAGVTATSDPSGNLTVSIPGGGSGGSTLAIRDENIEVEAAATTVNFVGDLVIASSISPGFVQVRVRGPQIFDSPTPGVQGVSVKQSATILELGPNIEKATFGNDGRVYLNAFGIAALDEGVEISSSNQLRALNFIGEGVTASSPFPGFVEINIPGGGASQSIAVADEGLELTAMLARLNFVGGGVMAEEIEPGVIQVSVPGETPITVLDEGAQVEADLMSINFVGDGVQATSDGVGNLTVTIPGAVEQVRFFDETRIVADENTVTGLNTIDPGLNPVTAINLGSTDASFAVTGGAGAGYLSVDIGLGAIQITPTAPLPDNAKGNYSIAIGSSDTTGTPAATTAIAEIAIGGTTNGSGGAIAIGLTSSAGATGPGNDGSVALGQSASANNKRGVAVGRSSICSAEEGTAVGSSTNAGLRGVAIGVLASTQGGNDGVAIGSGASAGSVALAIGSGASAGNEGTSVGVGSQSGEESIALGNLSSSLFPNSIAIGSAATASGQDSVVVGPLASTGQSGVSVGLFAVSGAFSVASGSGSNANGFDAVAVGRGAVITNGSLAQNNEGSIAIGAASTCDGIKNIALGALAETAIGVTNSVAIGHDSIAPASNQIQLGNAAQTTYVFGTVQDRSDARDKAEVRNTELGLDFIMSLRPVDFKWDYREDYFTVQEVIQEDGTVKHIKVPMEKDGSKVRSRYHHGFIAQEVGASGYQFGGHQDHSINNPGVQVQSLGYDEFVAPIVKSIQQQHEIIKALQQQVDELKARLQ